MDSPAFKKQLKIKTGAVKRLAKENNLYTKEIETGKGKKEKLIADGAEEWDIKNAGKLIEESEKLVKDTAQRLGAAVEDLQTIVVGAKAREDLAGDEDLINAEEVLATVVNL